MRPLLQGYRSRLQEQKSKLIELRFALLGGSDDAWRDVLSIAGRIQDTASGYGLPDLEAAASSLEGRRRDRAQALEALITALDRVGQEAPARLRVLIVDGDSEMRLLLQMALWQQSSYRTDIDTASSVEGGRSHALAHTPTVAVVEVSSETDEIISFISELRAFGCVVLALLPRSGSLSPQFLTGNGIVCAYTKPFDVGTLVVHIGQFLGAAATDALDMGLLPVSVLRHRLDQHIAQDRLIGRRPQSSFGIVAIQPPLTPDGQPVVPGGQLAVRLAHDLARLLPPRATVTPWSSRELALHLPGLPLADAKALVNAACDVLQRGVHVIAGQSIAVALFVGLLDCDEISTVEEAVAEAHTLIHRLRRSSSTRLQSVHHLVAASETIILAEDDDAYAAVISHRLQRDGFDVRSARDGLTALGWIRDNPPRLAVLSSSLPALDGLSLLRTMRHDLGLMQTGVMVVSTAGADRDIAAALDGGADDYVVKPFSPTEFAARARRLLRRPG